MGVRRSAVLSRETILTHRRRVGALDRRLPFGASSLRRAAWAGLQDSMPRAAVLSLHARVEDMAADGWEHPALVQLWGPRFSAFVVPADAVAAFTLGRLPVDGVARRRAEETADRLERFLAGRRMTYRAAGEGLGVNPNSLRYAATTGRVMLRWEGSGQPVVWTVDPPDVDEQEARLDLVRRYLHVFGPGTVAGFSQWAGVKPRAAGATFEALGDEVIAVETPVGAAWLLAEDLLQVDQSPADDPAPARLLPSGDAYFLRWGVDRNLLTPDAERRDQLWTSRVWPGAILIDGEIAGTWRRSGVKVDLTAWRPLTTVERDAVEAEVAALPLPNDDASIKAHWSRP